MADELELIDDRERARVLRRTRKVRGPRVVVDNAGLRKLTLELAEKRRRALRAKAAAEPAKR